MILLGALFRRQRRAETRPYHFPKTPAASNRKEPRGSSMLIVIAALGIFKVKWSGNLADPLRNNASRKAVCNTRHEICRVSGGPEMPLMCSKREFEEKRQPQLEPRRSPLRL